MSKISLSGWEKMLIKTLEVEKRFEDTHPMENWSLSDDTHPMKNDQTVSKSSIIDGVDQVEYL